MAEMALECLKKSLVTWLQEEELRAKRALRVINQQRDQIRRLQRLADQNESNFAPTNIDKEIGRGELCILKSLERLDVRSQEHSEEVKRIRQEIGETRAVLLRSKTRIEELEQMVQGVDACCGKEVAEVKELTKEMSAWRWTIDQALGQMNKKAEDEEEIRGDYLWKTALRFFTPQQVCFLLGGQIRGWMGAK